VNIFFYLSILLLCSAFYSLGLLSAQLIKIRKDSTINLLINTLILLVFSIYNLLQFSTILNTIVFHWFSFIFTVTANPILLFIIKIRTNELMRRQTHIFFSLLYILIILISHFITYKLELKNSALIDLSIIIFILSLSIKLLLNSRDINPKGFSKLFTMFSLIITLMSLGIIPVLILLLVQQVKMDRTILNAGFIIIVFLWNTMISIISLKSIEEPEKTNDKMIISQKDMKKYKLTHRERDILLLILDGYTSKSISERINLSQQTVKNYTHNAYKKMGVNNKMGLVNLIKKLNS